MSDKNKYAKYRFIQTRLWSGWVLFNQDKNALTLPDMSLRAIYNCYAFKDFKPVKCRCMIKNEEASHE